MRIQFLSKRENGSFVNQRDLKKDHLIGKNSLLANASPAIPRSNPTCCVHPIWRDPRGGRQRRKQKSSQPASGTDQCIDRSEQAASLPDGLTLSNTPSPDPPSAPHPPRSFLIGKQRAFLPRVQKDRLMKKIGNFSRSRF
ncbi:hypothetical protein CDAR_497561 [Caerostris darwini]|uniref:Uncharacterized protein n=1 Tax=Caerostris darwini TaxID=1538125 RepID=A0AAV4S3T4_9ARAC|nr:hypothetical protein CDAR_497561 [Caerostris darwini]